MKTEGRIVRLFIEEKKPKTIREISKDIRSDYKITHTATQRLLAKKILLSRTVGKSVLCELSQSYYGVDIYDAENERREDFLKNKNIRQLYKEVLGKTETSLFIFMVFGSYAKKVQTKSSDLDVMFISNDKDFEGKIKEILLLLPLKTHSLVFTEDEFIRMKDSKESNVIKEAIENNIILYGVENYYRLKNV